MTLSTIPPIETTTHPSRDPHAQHCPPPADPDLPRAVYAYDVDDVTYEYHHPTITGKQVMAGAGIPPTEGIILINADGTRETIALDTVVQLASGAHFKRRPRFKRG